VRPRERWIGEHGLREGFAHERGGHEIGDQTKRAEGRRGARTDGCDPCGAESPPVATARAQRAEETLDAVLAGEDHEVVARELGDGLRDARWIGRGVERDGRDDQGLCAA
jgi:hypothetical protein